MDFKTGSAQGQTFRFCDSGEGPPVVLIHDDEGGSLAGVDVDLPVPDAVGSRRTKKRRGLFRRGGE